MVVRGGPRTVRRRADAGRVVPTFIVQALYNEPITIYRDGSQTRSFCYVDNMITAFVALMAAPAEFSIRQFAAKLFALTESKSRSAHRLLPAADPTRRQQMASKSPERIREWNYESYREGTRAFATRRRLQ